MTKSQYESILIFILLSFLVVASNIELQLSADEV